MELLSGVFDFQILMSEINLWFDIWEWKTNEINRYFNETSESSSTVAFTIVFDTFENMRWKYWISAEAKCIPNDLEPITWLQENALFMWNAKTKFN